MSAITGVSFWALIFTKKKDTLLSKVKKKGQKKQTKKGRQKRENPKRYFKKGKNDIK